MTAWQRFLNSFDSHGGHIAVLSVGVLLGCGLTYVGVAEGHTVIVGSGGALLALLRSAPSA